MDINCLNLLCNLKKTHDFEQEHYQIKLSDIEGRIKSEEQKQNRLLDALLNGSITQPIFANKKSEIEQNIANLERERVMYKSADKNFKNAVITAFQLASRLHDIFLVSKNCEKREIINFVFSKLELTGKTLGYSLRCPFDMMVENAGCDTWLPLVSIFRTEKREEVCNFIKYTYTQNIKQTRLVT